MITEMEAYCQPCGKLQVFKNNNWERLRCTICGAYRSCRITYKDAEALDNDK